MGEFGDRMKILEGIECGRRFMPLLPICVRLDGKAFHSWTRKLDRPFDGPFSLLMLDTTKFLVAEANACMGYTQSDEINFIIHSDSYKSQTFFDGKIFKVISVLASMATDYFNRHAPDLLGARVTGPAYFDCRAWQVPNKEEATNMLLWREFDATRNSIIMAAQSVYSHKQLNGKNAKEMQEMLFQKGINWNDYGACFKRGTYVQRRKVTRRFSSIELEKLPPKHEARSNPELEYERTEINMIEMPPFASVINRVEVVFDGVAPAYRTEDGGAVIPIPEGVTIPVKFNRVEG
jgi:tRNA(His) 5'-end guanylyltransferase